MCEYTCSYSNRSPQSLADCTLMFNVYGHKICIWIVCVKCIPTSLSDPKWIHQNKERNLIRQNQKEIKYACQAKWYVNKPCTLYSSRKKKKKRVQVFIWCNLHSKPQHMESHTAAGGRTSSQAHKDMLMHKPIPLHTHTHSGFTETFVKNSFFALYALLFHGMHILKYKRWFNRPMNTFFTTPWLTRDAETYRIMHSKPHLLVYSLYIGCCPLLTSAWITGT